MTARREKSCALYHRASTVDQDPTLARDELRAAAAARAMRIALDVEETGSGARNDRPGLQRVLAAARRGKITHVLVWKLDRFGRNVLDVLSNVEELQNAGVGFVAVTQGLEVRAGNDSGDAMSRLLLPILAAVAEFERDLIRDRTNVGLKAALKRGAKLGRPRREIDLAWARELRAGGASLRDAAAAMGCSTMALQRALAAVPKTGRKKAHPSRREKR